MADEKMIVLKSSDGETFEVKESVAMKSITLKHMIEDDCANAIIPLHKLTSKTLSKVLEYCKHHTTTVSSSTEGTTEAVAANAVEDELKKFDEEFVKEVDLETMCSLAMAANYLDIRSILDLTCQTIANMIKDDSVEQVRASLHIKNDFTPEEEAEVRKENAWVFE